MAPIAERTPEAPASALDVTEGPRVLQRPLTPTADAVSDVGMLLVATVTATVTLPASERGLAAFATAGSYCVLVLCLLHARRFYVPRLSVDLIDDVSRIATVGATVSMVLIAVLVPLHGTTEPAGHILRLWLFASVYVIAGRVGVGLAERGQRGRGLHARNVLIVGAGTTGERLAERMLARRDLGLRPIGFLDAEPMTAAARRSGLPVLGTPDDLEAVAARHRVQDVMIAFSRASDASLLSFLERCPRAGLRVHIVPRMFDRMTQRVAVEHLGGIPLLRTEQVAPGSWQFTLKYAAERVIAAIVLVAIAPLLGLIASAIKLDSRGPVFFRQPRVGRDGVLFEIVKFRTMSIANDQCAGFVLVEGSAPGGVEGADRRTALGRLLRRWSLDELPQLLNVVRGEMALVGPRPERPEFALAFADNVPRYGDRHRVKSGLTGWAQVHGLRGRTSLEDRIEWDNYYIDNWSPWLDLKIMLLTVPAVISGRNAQ